MPLSGNQLHLSNQLLTFRPSQLALEANLSNTRYVKSPPISSQGKLVGWNDIERITNSPFLESGETRLLAFLYSRERSLHCLVQRLESVFWNQFAVLTHP